MESSNQDKKKRRDLERRKKSRSKYRHSTSDATPSSSFNQHYGSSSYGNRLHGVYGSSSMHSHASILSSSPAATSSSVLLSNKLIRYREGKVEVNCSFLRARCCSPSIDFSTLSKDLSAITKQISLFDLSNNELTRLPPICQSDRVESIALQCNMLKELVISTPINHLMVMNVSHNELTKFPDRRCIECMPLLRQLILNNNHIASIPVDSIRALADINIEVLDMASNHLSELPSEVELLTTLTSLDISYNVLRELPLSILKLKHLKRSISSLNVRGNVLISPPQQIAERKGLISIAEHFSAICNKGVDNKHVVSKGCHLKMVVVAHESVDKSILLKGLERWSSASTASDVPSPMYSSSRSNTNTTLYISHRCRQRIFGGLNNNNNNYQGNNNNNQDNNSNNNMLDDFTEVIKVNVFDCDGRDVYHSASELLFSQFALHLIVYDVRAVRTVYDCDKYVQFWVDLIQATVPGSSMVIAATHCDLLTEEEISARIEMLKERLRCNEEFRLADLRREIKACDNSSRVRLAALKRLEDMRPFIYDIVSLDSSSNSCSQPNDDDDDAGVEQLMRTIVHLVTPSSENKHPFNIINIQVPHHYQVVKLHIDDLKSSLGMKLKPFCTIASLEEQIQRVLEDSVAVVPVVSTKSGPHDPSTPIPIPIVKSRSEITPSSSTKQELSSGAAMNAYIHAYIY